MNINSNILEPDRVQDFMFILMCLFSQSQIRTTPVTDSETVTFQRSYGTRHHVIVMLYFSSFWFFLFLFLFVDILYDCINNCCAQWCWWWWFSWFTKKTMWNEMFCWICQHGSFTDFQLHTWISNCYLQTQRKEICIFDTRQWSTSPNSFLFSTFKNLLFFLVLSFLNVFKRNIKTSVHKNNDTSVCSTKTMWWDKV